MPIHNTNTLFSSNRFHIYFKLPGACGLNYRSAWLSAISELTSFVHGGSCVGAVGYIAAGN